MATLSLFGLSVGISIILEEKKKKKNTILRDMETAMQEIPNDSSPFVRGFIVAAVILK